MLLNRKNIKKSGKNYLSFGAWIEIIKLLYGGL